MKSTPSNNPGHKVTTIILFEYCSCHTRILLIAFLGCYLILGRMFFFFFVWLVFLPLFHHTKRGNSVDLKTLQKT